MVDKIDKKDSWESGDGAAWTNGKKTSRSRLFASGFFIGIAFGIAIGMML